MVMLGRIRSSQPGMYHDFSPIRVRNAGTSVIRTTSASVRMATASRSELLRDAIGGEDEGSEDGAHDHGRRDDHSADRGDPVLDGFPRLQPVDVLLPDPAHQEDHVVHREAEQDRERDRRHERLDQPCSVEAGGSSR